VKWHREGKTEALGEKPALVLLCLPQIPTWTGMGFNPDLSGEKLATTARAMARPQRIQGNLIGMEFVINDSDFE